MVFRHHQFKIKYPDGYVVKSEFKKIYFKNKRKTKGAELYLDNVFRAFDVNKNNEVDFNEFIAALGIQCRGSIDEKLRWMFSVFDMNSDGVISKSEMLCIIRALYKMGKKLQRRHSTPDSHVKEIFEKNDLNDDEVLTLDEFLQIQTTEPELMKAMCTNRMNIGI